MIFTDFFVPRRRTNALPSPRDAASAAFKRPPTRAPLALTRMRATSAPSALAKTSPMSVDAQRSRASATHATHARDASAPSTRSETSSSPVARSHDVIFFDCDDCLYKNDWRTANVITAKIESYTTERLGLPRGAAYQLYKSYGTCLRGLQEERYLEHEEELEEFLAYAHDVPLEIERDERLRAMLMKIKTPKWVFTASVASHARRCLEALGIDDLFEGIIDVRAVNWETKHSLKAYEAAMRIAGVKDPKACLFLDDSTSNMKTARAMGWTNILVGTHARDGGDLIVCEHADHIISTVHDFEALEHFREHFHDHDAQDAVPGETEDADATVTDAVPT